MCYDKGDIHDRRNFQRHSAVAYGRASDGYASSVACVIYFRYLCPFDESGNRTLYAEYSLMCTSTWRGNWLQGKWPDLALMLLFTSQSESKSAIVVSFA